MKTNLPTLVCVGLAAVTSSGCAEYFNVEEACHPKDTYVGQKELGAVEDDAFNRMNCYRRLAGVMRGTINGQMQDAATGQIAYVLANPNFDRILGSRGPVQYLSQVFDDPSYTGTTVFERLDAAEYVFVDPRGTTVEEFIYFVWDDEGAGTIPSGAAAMDWLFRDHVWRQYALQPSWIDGAYTEAELDRNWMIAAGYCKYYPESCDENGEPPTGLQGRVYYLLVVHSTPHVEKADKPFVYPKQDQTQVPLYSWSENLAALDIVGSVVPVQISYPITVFGGVIDETNAKLGDQNIYGLDIIASIVEVGTGPLETHIVLPGTTAEKVYPSGVDLRQVGSIFTREPLQPSTQYQLYADVTTYEGTFAVDFQFTTAAEDPGLQQQVNNYTTTSARISRSSEEIEAFVAENPHRAVYTNRSVP